VDGILVENENQLQLEEAMQKLMSNAELRRKMGASAEQVTSRFDIDVIVNEWLASVELLADRK
jgi:glycosyltransferase involved in cell wall biosynthesis